MVEKRVTLKAEKKASVHSILEEHAGGKNIINGKVNIPPNMAA